MVRKSKLDLIISIITFFIALSSMTFTIITYPHTFQSYEIFTLCLVVMIYAFRDFAESIDNKKVGGKDGR